MSDLNELNVGQKWYVVHTYTGYENKKFSSLETNGKISRIYFCKPDTWCNVEIAIDNLKIYEYMPFEFNGISDDGGVLFNETPEMPNTCFTHLSHAVA